MWQFAGRAHVLRLLCSPTPTHPPQDLLYIESPFTYDVNASKASSAKHLGLDKYNQRAFFQSLR